MKGALSMMNNGNSNLRSWDEVQREIFTSEEIAESDLRVEIIGALIKARQEQGISQKKLEELEKTIRNKNVPVNENFLEDIQKKIITLI